MAFRWLACAGPEPREDCHWLPFQCSKNAWSGARGKTQPTAQAFFNTLWVHTIEGMFADPIYGGNRDFAGWRLIEFPGAQQFYTRSDMQTDAKFTRMPILGLQQQYEERRSQAGGE